MKRHEAPISGRIRTMHGAPLPEGEAMKTAPGTGDSSNLRGEQQVGRGGVAPDPEKRLEELRANVETCIRIAAEDGAAQALVSVPVLNTLLTLLVAALEERELAMVTSRQHADACEGLRAELKALRAELDESNGDHVTLDSFCKAHGTPLMVLGQRDAALAQVAELREALKRADDGIASGQDVQTEAAFARWRNDVQALRPHGDLLALAATEPPQLSKDSVAAGQLMTALTVPAPPDPPGLLDPDFPLQEPKR